MRLPLALLASAALLPVDTTASALGRTTLRRPPRATMSEAPAAAPAAAAADYSQFEWTAHWYPVAWAADCPEDAPIKVTLFDEDYAVVKRGGGRAPIAFRDRCPHRLAALSEGRVTAQGFLQCSYHGWAFDADAGGACVSIPQLMPSSPADPPFAPPARACAPAVACALVDGMLWVHPSARSAAEARFPIPRVPEMAAGLAAGYRCVTAVRDFPVDYSLMIENVLDPDHGLFAHRARGFDLYSASHAHAQAVRVEAATAGASVGASPSLLSEVDAVPKLTRERDGADAAAAAAPARGETRFTPPCLVHIGRREPPTPAQPAPPLRKFVTAFWLVPVGVGRVRFMSAAVARAPVLPPRWVQHVALNNFLDEDTYLLATQQPALLAAELAAHERRGAARAAAGGGGGAAADAAGALAEAALRRRLYTYASPSEKLLLELGRFLDACVPRMPARYARPELLRAASCPPREAVLDRAAQHTAVCPDSQAVVARARLVRAAALLGALALALAQLCARGAAWRARPLACAALLLLLLVAKAADALLGEFRFKRGRALHAKGVAQIARVFPDAWLVGGR